MCGHCIGNILPAGECITGLCRLGYRRDGSAELNRFGSVLGAVHHVDELIGVDFEYRFNGNVVCGHNCRERFLPALEGVAFLGRVCYGRYCLAELIVLSAYLLTVGFVYDGIGVCFPYRVQLYNCAVFGSEVLNNCLVGIACAGAVRCGVPSGEVITDAFKAVCGECCFAVVNRVDGSRSACAAVCVKYDGVAVCRPACGELNVLCRHDRREVAAVITGPLNEGVAGTRGDRCGNGSRIRCGNIAYRRAAVCIERKRVGVYCVESLNIGVGFNVGVRAAPTGKGIAFSCGICRRLCVRAPLDLLGFKQLAVPVAEFNGELLYRIDNGNGYITVSHCSLNLCGACGEALDLGYIIRICGTVFEVIFGRGRSLFVFGVLIDYCELVGIDLVGYGSFDIADAHNAADNGLICGEADNARGLDGIRLVVVDLYRLVVGSLRSVLIYIVYGYIIGIERICDRYRCICANCVYGGYLLVGCVTGFIGRGDRCALTVVESFGNTGGCRCAVAHLVLYGKGVCFAVTGYYNVIACSARNGEFAVVEREGTAVIGNYGSLEAGLCGNLCGEVYDIAVKLFAVDNAGFGVGAIGILFTKNYDNIRSVLFPNCGELNITVQLAVELRACRNGGFRPVVVGVNSRVDLCNSPALEGIPLLGGSSRCRYLLGVDGVLGGVDSTACKCAACRVICNGVLNFLPVRPNRELLVIRSGRGLCGYLRAGSVLAGEPALEVVAELLRGRKSTEHGGVLIVCLLNCGIIGYGVHAVIFIDLNILERCGLTHSLNAERNIHADSSFGCGEYDVGMSVAVLNKDIYHLQAGEQTRVAACPLGGSDLFRRAAVGLCISYNILSDIFALCAVIYTAVLNIYLLAVFIIEMSKNICVAVVILCITCVVACKVVREDILASGDKARYAVVAFRSARFGVGLIIGILVIFVGYNVVVLIKADRIVRRRGVFALCPLCGKEKVIKAYLVVSGIPLRDKRIGFTLEGIEITAVYVRLVGINSRHRTVYKSAPANKFITVSYRLGNKHGGFGCLLVAELRAVVRNYRKSGDIVVALVCRLSFCRNRHILVKTKLIPAGGVRVIGGKSPACARRKCKGMFTRCAGVKVCTRIKVAVLEKEELRYGVVVRPAYCVGLTRLKVYPYGYNLSSFTGCVRFAVGKALIVTGDVKRASVVAVGNIIGKSSVSVVARCGRCAMLNVEQLVFLHRAACGIDNKLCRLCGNCLPLCGELAVTKTEGVCAVGGKIACPVKPPTLKGVTGSGGSSGDKCRTCGSRDVTLEVFNCGNTAVEVNRQVFIRCSVVEEQVISALLLYYFIYTKVCFLLVRSVIRSRGICTDSSIRCTRHVTLVSETFKGVCTDNYRIGTEIIFRVRRSRQCCSFINYNGSDFKRICAYRAVTAYSLNKCVVSRCRSSAVRSCVGTGNDSVFNSFCVCVKIADSVGYSSAVCKRITQNMVSRLQVTRES